MKLHANAALTVAQRRHVKRLFDTQQFSLRALAQRFQVHPATIRRWVYCDSPYDRTHRHPRQRRVVTSAYEQAVLRYRHEHPTHGPLRIAQALHSEFPQAHRGTVLLLLQRAGVTRPHRVARRPQWQIPVGRHRVQMDMQQLPAIKGGAGFEYKISLIHLKTRCKYSEMHQTCDSATVAAVFQRALDSSPPFLSCGPTTP